MGNDSLESAWSRPRKTGVQSEYPIHMDLLDWLAVQFQDLGWSQKMYRLIVTSSATGSPGRMMMAPGEVRTIGW